MGTWMTLIGGPADEHVEMVADDTNHYRYRGADGIDVMYDRFIGGKGVVPMTDRVYHRYAYFLPRGLPQAEEDRLFFSYLEKGCRSDSL